jgi:hypothetical protein
MHCTNIYITSIPFRDSEDIAKDRMRAQSGYNQLQPDANSSYPSSLREGEKLPRLCKCLQALSTLCSSNGEGTV